MRTIGLVFGVMCALCSASIVEPQSPYVVGAAGFGYKFAIEDGDGNLIIATNPVGEYQTLMIKSPIGSTGVPSGPNSGQATLLKNKGHVTSGCIATVNSQKFLFAGLSTSGYILKLDLSFPAENAVIYLNVTDQDTLWSTGPPQTLVSAVCQGQFVYFGSKSPVGSSHVLRLDTMDTNPATRFTSLGAIAQGDLSFGSQWGTDAVIFAMEPDTDVPLSFFIISTTGTPHVEVATPVSPSLTGFDTLSGFTADITTKRVLVANANGAPQVAVLQLNQPSLATTEQHITLATNGLLPITTFTVDKTARYAYASVGDCSEGSDVAFVAIRLAPELTQMEISVANQATYNCAEMGTPSVAVLTKTTPRQVLVFTELEFSTPSKDGHIIPYNVASASACPSNCHEDQSHGDCAGGVCYCSIAYSGVACDQAKPCGGTECSHHGTCVTASNACECEVGWSGESCENNVLCPNQCSSHGSCTENGCVCVSGYAGTGCEHETVGCASLSDCSGHGSCVPGYPVGSCSCAQGFIGANCGEQDLHCLNNCSGNGLCVQGTCECNPTFTGSDCSLIVANCPNNCSAHGVCRNARCTCERGFMGLDCSTVDRSVCPSGCSGHGTCVSGQCICESGWKGRNCTVKDADLRVAHETILVAGENQATASFVVSVTRSEVVFCTASTPGKCIGFDPLSMERTHSSTFQDQSTNMLLQGSEGVDTAKMSGINSALMPDLTAITSVSLVELGAAIGDAPISVAVAEDTPNGFVILGTKLTTNGTMHGQLLKVSLATFERLAELELSDDNGRGVSAGVAAGDGTFFFASGNNPATIYRVNSALEIVAKSSAEQSPLTEVSVLVFDSVSNTLIATSRGTVFAYQTTATTIDAHPSTPSTTIPASHGEFTCGFIDKSLAISSAVLGTSASPAAVFKFAMETSAVRVVASTRLGENRITTVTRKDDFAYFGLGVDSSANTCFIAKVSISGLRELDVLDIHNCTSDPISASVSTTGDFAYFGTAGSPAHVYSVRLFARSSCPGNCSNHGVCVEGTCSCNEGWQGDLCDAAIPQCLNDCSHAGTCNNGVCVCDEGHFNADCSVIMVCQEKCQHGQCTGSNGTWPCACESNAWSGVDCSIAEVYCPNECSSHGACQAGTCVCDLGFGGIDCATVLFPPVSGRGCSIDSDCGTHGVCEIDDTATGHCKCAEGWSGLDCDVDEEYREQVSTDKTSVIVIGVVVAVALVLGAVGGVSVWKSWAKHSQSMKEPTPSMPDDSRSRVTSQPYHRLPKRLVK